MNIIANRDILIKDPNAQLVIEKLKEIGLPEESIIYYQFPLYRGDLISSTIQAHVLVISPRHGVVCLLCKGNSSYSLSNYEIEKLDEVFLQVEKRLKSNKGLRTGRNLKIPLNTIVINSPTRTEEGISYVDINELRNYFKDLETETISLEDYQIIQGCIEGTSRILRKKERDENGNPKSKSAILNRIQSAEAVFDNDQKKVALQTIDGPQRIRGLAGSGKTIILAMKAAIYHLKNPEANILYTYYTKSLHDTIKTLIERFYKDFSDNQLPDWDKIFILHGWGGKGVPGVYSTACEENNTIPIPFSLAKYRNPSDPFGYICDKLLETSVILPKYDLTIIDEGQDFPSSFYRLCLKLTKDCRLVWAYDDFQNIFDTKIQNEKETFGKDNEGKYLIDFAGTKDPNPYQDIVLKTCYRTPKEILTAAFSLGLGIYNESVLQRLEDNTHWESLGFQVENGDSSDGCKMVISRPSKNSPSIMNENFGCDSLRIEEFNDWIEECNFVINQIENNIKNEGLRPDDICVICLKERAMESYYNQISAQLSLKDIACFNLLNVPNNNVRFFKEGEVTLATINKAKGNEAGMIYIIGVDSVFVNPNHVVARNRLFTAMTRAKGWVTLTGCEDLSHLKKEHKKLSDNKFRLCFAQPSKESTRTIENVSRQQHKNIEEINRIIQNLKDSGLSIETIKKMLGLNG